MSLQTKVCYKEINYVRGKVETHKRTEGVDIPQPADLIEIQYQEILWQNLHRS